MNKNFLNRTFSTLAVTVTGATFAFVPFMFNAGQAQAASITFTGSGTNLASGGTSNALSASVTFNNDIAGQLGITLSNTGPGTSVPSDILTALFWDVTGNPTLSLSSATAQTIIPTPTGTSPYNIGDVNGTSSGGIEWGFSYNATDLNGAVAPLVTQSYGLGTAGFGISPGFGLSGGQQMNYGIVSTPYDSPNPAVTGGTFVVGSANFVLSGFTGIFDLNRINNIRFQYGTALNEPSFAGSTPTPTPPPTPVPEPSAILGLAVIGGALKLLRRKK